MAPETTLMPRRTLRRRQPSSHSWLDQIARGALPLLGNRRGNTLAFRVGVLLCCHANTPGRAVAEMLNPDNTAAQFRKVLARESNRSDALAARVRSRRDRNARPREAAECRM
jgi:hypothetical protein